MADTTAYFYNFVRTEYAVEDSSSETKRDVYDSGDFKPLQYTGRTLEVHGYPDNVICANSVTLNVNITYGNGTTETHEAVPFRFDWPIPTAPEELPINVTVKYDEDPEFLLDLYFPTTPYEYEYATGASPRSKFRLVATNII
jgi:hypothetical protein